MRYVLFVFFCVVAFKLSAQTSGRVERQVLYLTKTNGDTIEIIAQAKADFSDTAVLTIYSIKSKKHSQLQQFKTLVSFPLEIKATSFDGKKGFLVTYDPAAKWGNAFLYLFDETKKRFYEVEGFRELGLIKTIVYKNQRFFYSYISCGCADDCWVSKLFIVNKYRLQILEEFSCDCSKLIATHSKTGAGTTCDVYNNNQKFENIAKYWRNVVKGCL